jgi:acyl carrier protein
MSHSIAELVIKTMEDRLGIPFGMDHATVDTEIAEFAPDSLDTIEILMDIEQQLHIDWPQPAFDEMTAVFDRPDAKVGDLVDLVEKHKPKA